MTLSQPGILIRLIESASIAEVMQAINHQIGVCIDAVICFPGIGVMAYLNGLIDPFRIAKAQQGLRLG